MLRSPDVVSDVAFAGSLFSSDEADGSSDEAVFLAAVCGPRATGVGQG